MYKVRISLFVMTAKSGGTCNMETHKMLSFSF